MEYMNWNIDREAEQVLKWTMELIKIPIFGFGFLATVSVISWISMLGLISSVKDSRCLVISYGLLMTLIVLLQIGGGAFDWAYESEIQNEIKKILKENIAVHYDPKPEMKNEVTALWHLTMTENQSC